MASAGAVRLYRLALAVAAVGLLGVIMGLVTAAGTTALAVPSLDALAAACVAVIPDGVQPMALLPVAMGGLGAAVLARGAFSLWRRLRRHRRTRPRAEGRELGIAGATVTLIDDQAPVAFCAGWVRPRLYVSTGAVARLDGPELEAVVEHERQHRRRRDPLRILVLEVLADALFFLPGVRVAARRYRALAEIAADEAAVGRVGRERFASALLAFGDAQGSDDAVVGIAPERVDRLLGQPTPWALPMLALFASSLAATGLLALAGALLLAAGSTVSSSVLLAQACMAMLCPLLAIGSMVVIGASRRRPRSSAR